MATLGSVLVQEGLVTADQLQDARDKQVGAKKPLQEVLVEMGFITEELLVKAIAKAFNAPLLGPEETIDFSLIKLIPFEASRRHGIFPVHMHGPTLLLAMSNPVDMVAIDDIKTMTGLMIKPILATRSQIDKLIGENYHLSDYMYDLLKNVTSSESIKLIREDAPDGKALDVESIAEDNSPVIKLVNLMLSDAVKMRASDIHIEPQENFVVIRYRIDGYLKNIMKVPGELHPRLAARIKVLAALNIAETRKAQDGRIKVLVGDHRVDLRISTVPTFYGEKIVMRLLDRREAKTDLATIGFEEKELDTLRRALQKTQGIILVTGPTGSGKTSTLYAALNAIKGETKNITTIEDPIEYLIDGVNQIQLNPIKDVTFSTSLRSILRQDPNIIFVGEIRDKDTAEIAFRASQTGHLVLSTLHTNDAISSITRLVDIGLERYLIASSLVMVVSQRLIRLICNACKEEYIPDSVFLKKYEGVIARYGIKKFFRGRGCQQCGFGGFFGRSAIFEILEIDDSLRTSIINVAEESHMAESASRAGMKTLLDSAINKVTRGMSTLEEITHVIDIASDDKMAEKEAISTDASEARKTDRAASGVEIGKARQGKILIVDDEKDLLVILRKYLIDAGYDIVEANNGRVALEAVARERPDLIVMDVNMPIMDGFETTRALRSSLATASIPVILLTALKDKASELTGLDAGADDYITKPYDRDKLLARVKMLLRRR